MSFSSRRQELGSQHCGALIKQQCRCTIPGSEGAQRRKSLQGDGLTMESSRTYLPAAGRDWLLPLYDPFVKLLGGDAARKALLDQAAIRASQRVLDIGCGTGTLVVMIKR